jgi:heptosyltransferase-2
MQQFHNIFVSALVNLGDTVLSTGAVALLKKAYPDARITVLVKPSMRGIVDNNRIIDYVMVLSDAVKPRSLRALLRLAGELRKHQFDLSFSLDRDVRSAFAAWKAGIPVRVGPDHILDSGEETNHAAWFYTDTVAVQKHLDDTPQGDTYQELVRSFTGTREQAAPVLPYFSAIAEQQVAVLFSELLPSERHIALCIKSRNPLKTWPKEYFIELVERLSTKYDATFYILGAPEQRAYADDIIKGMPLPVADFCGRTNLLSLIILIAKSDLLITVDTGVVPIAAATGIPTVVIYGCSSPVRWGPLSYNARTVSAGVPCSPCHRRPEECPSRERPECLYAVKPEKAAAVCEELMEEQIDDFTPPDED